MKKFLSLALTGSALCLLAGCDGIPKCNDQDMDKCGFGTIYSEERTAVGVKKPAPKAEPTPVPVAAPAPAPMPEPVMEPEPEPMPEPVDTSIMRQADEPDLSK